MFNFGLWQRFIVFIAYYLPNTHPLLIDYLRTENQIYREILGKEGLAQMSGDQRRRLAKIGTPPDCKKKGRNP